MSGRYETPLRQVVHSRTMQPVDHPSGRYPDGVEGAWQSRDFLAVLYSLDSGPRLTVNRVQIDKRTGMWRDGITWDELQRIKDQCGFADSWAVEVFPPADLVVNVASMRHLWLLPEPPQFGWHEPPAEGDE